MSAPTEVYFDSGGVSCAADLYWPGEALTPVPCVVMGHGASATKRLGLPRYAAKFAACGIAVLAFDYRGWGASRGQPRQVVDAGAQRDDYHAAIRYARAHPGIDPDRIAVWGTSLSGGHVLDVAAHDSRLAAVVCQVPTIDARRGGRCVRRWLSPERAVRLVRITVAAVRDVRRARRGLPPLLVRVVGKPWQLAVFTDPGARAALAGLDGESVGWRNEIAPRVMLALPRYRAGTAEHLGMPVLMCLADHDAETSSKFAMRVAAAMPAATVLHYPLGHFDVYVDPNVEPISDAQARFLQQTLKRPVPHRRAGTAIKAEGLTKRFGRTLALDHLDIEVERGEIFGFLGPNGAGKTTTVRLLLNLLRPSAGDAWIMGIPVREVERAHRHVSYIPGDVVLWPQLTGAETLEYLGNLSGQTDPAFRDELIERFQLEADRRVRSYSKGNRQKVALVAAFMTRPDILLLDEPTAGLDPLMEAEFKALAREARERGQTVFLSSHLLDEVEDVCDRVAILRTGKLVEVSSLTDLRRLSSTIFEVRFEGAPPSFDAVPGVVASEPIGHGLRLTVEGSPSAVLSRLAAAPVAELRSRTPTLEEIFLTYYDTSEAAREAAVPANPYGR